jgi:hypothetical protein
MPDFAKSCIKRFPENCVLRKTDIKGAVVVPVGDNKDWV